jgi:hypothetical protein
MRPECHSPLHTVLVHLLWLSGLLLTLVRNRITTTNAISLISRRLSVSKSLLLIPILEQLLWEWEAKGEKETTGSRFVSLSLHSDDNWEFWKIYKQVTDRKPSLILWFFDSRGGDSPGPHSHPLEDWVHPSVADWIRKETELMDHVWGDPTDRGSLAFVHIPP